ncbi:MAG: polysaccharide deacetylase family protein [Oscillospiraceae bacterium]|nr:polysaccharide deacetylase family protein [Oscillospiraceae bacterium]
MRYRTGRVWKGLLLFLLTISLTAVGVNAYFRFKTENEVMLTLTLRGAQEITLEYGTVYEDPGADASLVYINVEKAPVAVSVTQQGSVDDQKLGQYSIVYSAVYQDQVCTAVRTVYVVDTQAPTITLDGKTAVTVLPTEKYQEEGFTASDNYDGNLTGQVQREECDGKILYTVTDSSGNCATAERTVTVDDPVAPVLELKGNTSITVGIGAKYEEPGFSAIDNCDGDLTAAVQVSGWVDLYREGVYTLKYTVTDSFQNSTSVTRTICVLPLKTEDIAPKNGKTIYLTFDDGPGPYTEKLLDVLNKYQVKASFFAVNTGYVSLLTRIAQEGHTVAIHTASHRFNKIYVSEDAYFADLYKMQGIIEQYTGQKSMLLRFPGGSSNAISKDYCEGIMTRLTAAVEEQGFTYFDWNVDSNDAGGAKTAEQVFRNVINGIGEKENSVVLQHDIKSYSVDAVEKIVVWGLKNGYTFLPLDANSPSCHHDVNN